MRWTVATLVACQLAACGGAKSQSFEAAVGIVCATDKEAGVAALDPDERPAARARWIEARLKHPEVKAAFADLGSLTTAGRRRILASLATRAKLTMCGDRVIGDGPRWTDNLDVVALPTAGTIAVQPGDLTVVVATDAIYYDGERVATLRDGKPDPATPDGGVPLLTDRVREDLDPSLPPDTSLRIVLGKDTTYAHLMTALTAAKKPGVANFELVGAGEGGARAVPLPLRPAAASVNAEMAMLAITDKLVLFSASGALGTIAQPAVTTAGTADADLAQVQAALVEARPRLAGARQAVILADSTVPVRTVLAAMAAVRAAPDGSELLPDIMLSAGFR